MQNRESDQKNTCKKKERRFKSQLLIFFFVDCRKVEATGGGGLAFHVHSQSAQTMGSGRKCVSSRTERMVKFYFTEACTKKSMIRWLRERRVGAECSLWPLMCWVAPASPSSSSSMSCLKQLGATCASSQSKLQSSRYTHRRRVPKWL